ncbi:MAG: hypothetical protein ACR2LM_08340 [Pyrinomonadaceae bacterium]
MKKPFFVTLAFLTLAIFSFQSASAQFPRVPKIPRPNQPKPQPTPNETAQPASASETQPASRPQPDTRGMTSAPTAATTQGQPAIIKTWIQVTANTISSYKGNFDIWSWLPQVAFSTTGRPPSGANYSVEFTQPGGARWVTLDCESTSDGYECGGPNDARENAITAVGPVSFTIKMRNELAGTDATIFTGKTRVEKVLSNEYGPKAANHFVYFVNQDWNIGYLLVDTNSNYLNVAFWLRGETGNTDPHLFYQGKEVGLIFHEDIQVGAPSCNTEVDLNTTMSTAESVPHRGKWRRMLCEFKTVLGQNKGEKFGFGKPFFLSENPGEYEFKLLRNKKLARSIKFTVGADGGFENGINAANKVGGRRVIVPVTIIGDQDGPWDKNAWRTDAFYGNPLTGFTPAP